MNQENKYMELAIKLSEENIDNGGGPFGAVIVKDGEIIATGTNRVVPDTDPTAHAEINAIRKACKKIGDFKLTGCTIYSSCEPCPMCLSAIYWAGISKIVYGNTKEDAKTINFDDSFIYEEIDKKPECRSIKAQQIMHKEAFEAFKIWDSKTDKIRY
jgi:Cytosine/adenosine deaminases